MLGLSRARLVAGVFIMATALTMSGCATLRPEHEPQAFPELPQRMTISNVPFHAQEKYHCGPATLAMVLNWSGVDVTPNELVSQVYSPARQGAFQVEMMGAVRRYGRLAYPMEGLDALLQELAAGTPVIVLQNLSFGWAPIWHYAVVLGYDLDTASIVMHSGVTQDDTVDWVPFVKTWERADFWGLLALPPGQVPVSATEASYLKAVLGLEQVNNWEAAVVAYEAAMERWPQSLGALMGAGNSRYALGDLIGAEETFRRATEVAPDNGAAHNNLAHVLAEQGKYEAALESVRRAIAAGGPQKDLFEQTLKEIEDQMAPSK